MQLYKMELYKICQNKAFVRAFIATLGILLLFFWFVEVGDEIATVNGVYYQGYAAVQKNREITEEFEGVVTDEKLVQMVEKYGFPKEVKEDYPGFRDANYLTSFVVAYFSDGYMNGWDDYKAATKLYPMEETEIGKQGKEISLYYTKGWKVFLEIFLLGMILGSITILVGISVVFSQESQIRMLPLLFTTKRGKKEDISAKILASFTVMIGVYIVVMVLSIALCYFIFGLDGAQSPYWLVMEEKFGLAVPIRKIVGIVLAASLLALSYLCAVTLCVSAHAKSTFRSVVVATICWVSPVLLRMIFWGFPFLLVSNTPIFLVMYRNIAERIYFTTYENQIAVMNMYLNGIIIMLAVTGLIVCVINGYLSYRKR